MTPVGGSVEVEHAGRVATVTIHRPSVLNALDEATLRELQRTFAELESRPDVRCIVLTGHGRAFVSGADIRAMHQLTPEQASGFSRLGHQTFSAIEGLAMPVIAAVNGYALGGGCELALACDFILAAEGATFGQPEVRLGIIPAFGGIQRLSRRVGVARARELIYTGRMLDAAEAVRIGLANAMCAQDELLARAHALGEAIGEAAPLAVAAAKRLLRESEDLTIAAADAAEEAAFGRMFSTADQREGMAAFFERRPPAFTGQ